MPIEIKKGETEEQYVGRCIGEEVNTGIEQDQAVAICYSKWREQTKLSTQDKFISQMNQYRKKLELQEGCPEATQSIPVNLENRQRCIDEANYGPLNPNEPNEDYWKAKANQFGGDVSSAKTALCGNCAFFVQTKKMLDCIAGGINNENEWDTIAAGSLGFCEAYDFKCSAERTCDAWVVGGPITD